MGRSESTPGEIVKTEPVSLTRFGELAKKVLHGRNFSPSSKGGEFVIKSDGRIITEYSSEEWSDIEGAMRYNIDGDSRELCVLDSYQNFKFSIKYHELSSRWRLPERILIKRPKPIFTTLNSKTIYVDDYSMIYKRGDEWRLVGGSPLTPEEVNGFTQALQVADKGLKVLENEYIASLPFVGASE